MEHFLAFFSQLASLLLPFIGKLILAAVVWFVGRFVIKKVMVRLDKGKKFQSMESTVRGFLHSFAKAAMYVLLVISVVGILGVETASIITALASAGVAIGLALQGALSNLAGGIMLVIFKPFKQGDYIDAGGASGTVTDVTLFYTVLITPDGKRITVPNGTLMNANVVDYSSEEMRRMDVTCTCARTEDPMKVLSLMREAIAATPSVCDRPEAPVARISGTTNEAIQFTARVWVKNADYWTVNFDLTHKITVALCENGIQAPTVRISSAEKE